MDRKLGRLIVMLVYLTSGVASAQSAPGLGKETFTTYGLANETCGSYIEARRMPGTEQAYGYSQFIGGYLTASGIGKRRPYPYSMAGIEGWIENYCQKNPEQAFIFALGAYTTIHDGPYKCIRKDGSVEYTNVSSEGCKQISANPGQ